MRELNTGLKYFVLTAALVLMGSVGAFGQAAKGADEYVSPGKFSFRIPKDSMPYLTKSEQPIVYAGRPRMTMGSDAALMLTWRDVPNADKLAAFLSDDKYIDMFTNGVVKQTAGSNEFTILEKKRVQIAGLNALKVVLTVTMDKVKNRWAVYTIPCPEHNRMYSFTISTTDEKFDNWFAIAEPSVNSFKILKN